MKLTQIEFYGNKGSKTYTFRDRENDLTAEIEVKQGNKLTLTYCKGDIEVTELNRIFNKVLEMERKINV